MAEKNTYTQAIVLIKGHQYLVHPGQKLRVSRIAGDEGNALEFTDVYCVIDGEAVRVGTPLVPGARVKAKLVKQARGRKVIAFKYRPKARSRVKKGFRASESEIEILDVKA